MKERYDLCVVGGGFAGVCAAVAAAREGVPTLLIERDGCLGGALSSGLVYPFMKHTMKTEDGGRIPLSAGLFTEIKQRKIAYGDTSYETFKFVFDDMATEAGVDLLFHTTVTGVVTEGRQIASLTVATKSGTREVFADRYIDATGDGEVLALAGCAFELGRTSDGYSQPMTTCFRVTGVDVPLFTEEKDKMQTLYKEWREAKKISNPRENVLFFLGLGQGVVHFNTTRIVKCNPVDPEDLSRAEVEARRQVAEMMVFFKENLASFKQASLLSVATHIGVRESRRLVGEYVLTAQDLISARDFPDTVALGNYDIDIHNPVGTGTEIHTFPDGTFYRIPYRSLLPREYDNLLVAGRCLSATHEAHSAVRIMPICACLGEAAGCAAAVSQKNGSNFHTLDTDALQTLLRSRGAAIM